MLDVDVQRLEVFHGEDLFVVIRQRLRLDDDLMADGFDLRRNEAEQLLRLGPVQFDVIVLLQIPDVL